MSAHDGGGDGGRQGAGKLGLIAAADKVLGEAEAADPAAGEGEQLPLLPMSEDRAAPAAGHGADRERRRGPGRPPGARNRRSVEWIEWLERQGYANPLQALASMWSQPVEELARRLGCKRVEALKVQRDAAAAALPYWAEKMPVAVNLGGGDRPILVLGALDAAAEGAVREAAELGDDRIVIDLQPIGEGEKNLEGNQGVADGAAAESDGGESDGDG